MKLGIIAAAALIVFAGTLMLVSPRQARASDGDGDGRFQHVSVYPVSDSYFGECVLFDLTVGTSAAGDLGFETIVSSAQLGYAIHHEREVFADSPLTGASSPLTSRVRMPVDGYESGDTLTITVHYKDVGESVVDTESVQITIP